MMELLVVMGIVSTVVVAATDIFMLAGRSQRKIFSLERAQADARYTLEAIAREVRNGQIDYAYYGGAVTSPAEELALIDSTNVKIRFHKSTAADESSCADPSSVPCLLVTIGSGQPAPLTPEGVIARNVKFYVSPTVDPFFFDPATSAYAANMQPRATVVLVLESIGVRAGEGSIVSTQTTVVSRVYRR
jgi:type II secretory pathway pseudopilin PulG